MRIDGPTNPHHVARAYGVRPPAPMQAPAKVDPVRPAQPTADVAARIAPSNIDRLVAARVPGGVDFSTPQPTPSAPSASIPFYRHPADRNNAAVAVTAGRTLDVSG